MDLKDILKALSVETLSEEQQNEVSSKLEDLVSMQVNEQIAERLEEEKERLVEEFEAKYEEYKNDITAKFSNFVDEILEEEMVIPENVLEYARYGELYKDIIDQLKVRIGIDEGALDEEARELLKEARDEIIRLQDQLNEEIEEKLESQRDAQELALETYRQMTCESVPASQRGKVLTLLEGTKTKEEIDRKFSFIVENKLFEGAEHVDVPQGNAQVTLNENLNTNPDTDSPFKDEMDMWVSVLRNNK